MGKIRISFTQVVVIVASMFCWRIITMAQSNMPSRAHTPTAAARSAVQGLQPPTSAGGFLPTPGLSDRTFFIHDAGHRCLDFGAQQSWATGNPVYIYSCNGTIAQQVRVREVNEWHDVNLMVQSQFCLGVRGGTVVVGQPLELQTCDGVSPAQRFALDGDSIMMGGQAKNETAEAKARVSREYVIEPQCDYTSLRTPLVVGTREVSDAEYFRFEAADHSSAWPTSGFVRVSNETWLDWALSLGWGAVIEIDDQQALELKGPFPKHIHSGVTLRGYRKYTYQGPEIHTCITPADQSPLFSLVEDNVRVTGMRLRGPRNDSRCPSSTLVETQAVRIDGAPQSVLIDHLDIGYFNGSAVDARGPAPEIQECQTPPLPYPRDATVRVIGNLIHHNYGFGSVTGTGTFVLTRGNVFYDQQAQSIAADAFWGGFNAYDNLVLSVDRLPNKNPTDDIDMHGSLNGNATTNSWQGGISGDYFDVGWNTFLHVGHENILQRGTPCRFTAIHDNVFLQSQGASIATMTTNPSTQVVYANTFSAPNPMDELAVGDFDGDGIDDVFVGTGGAWYFSSGGQSEWRILNRMPERASALRFGDFDGDGRTDVIAVHGSHIDVSWGALSSWQTINTTTGTLAAIAVGDFDGDHSADLFFANGTAWFYAPGGKNWTPLASETTLLAQVLFGDFTHQGRTQVLRVSNGQWQVAGLGQSWRSIGAAPVTSAGGLVVADFNGDGYMDVAATNGSAWQFTTPAQSPTWMTLRSASIPIAAQVIGRFDGNNTADAVVWSGRDLFIAPSGRNPLKQLSRQDMR